MKVYPVSKRQDNKKFGFLQDPDSKLDLNHTVLSFTIGSFIYYS